MSLALTTDLYELTMAASYLSRGMTDTATFSLFVRDLPPDRGFLVAAGLDSALGVLADLAFDDEDLGWLAAHGFDQAAIDAFAILHFTGDVWAIPEGHVVLPNEPLIEVTAPLPEAQLVESILLNQITFQTALATKAARCSLAAGGRASLVDFSLRRTHGIEASLAAARAAAIAGFAGTSNVDAARRLGIPAIGTMAHSYIEAFPTERQAFVAMATDFPERTAFLVDTYDTVSGVETAVDVAAALDMAHLAVRIDSGDLLALSKRAREILDAAHRPDATIIVSGGLDEFDVARLLDDGAPIDAFGVGTRVGVSADAPSLETVYKLVEYGGRPTVKLSEGKQTRPGAKQVHRPHTGTGDVLAARSEPAPAGTTPLLIEVMRDGKRIAPAEPIQMAADRLAADVVQLPESARLLRNPTVPRVRVSETLEHLTREVTVAHRTTGR
jgi:nicotinate phosphoribosyltransferase